MRFPVFDLHCDTALELVGGREKKRRSLRENDLHIDLKRAGNFGGYTQCFACFTTDAIKFPEGITPEIIFQQEKSAILSEIENNSDLIRQAFTAQDIIDNQKNGIFSGVLTIEGTAGFGFDPDTLKELYDLGFRITTLGWNESNALTGSHRTGGGLTEKGVCYVKTAQDLGMIVDVSHISDEAFWDIMKITKAPIIASHSNSRTVHGASRNLTDEMFLAICETGGVVGINLYTDFLGEDADLDTVCDHIEHFLKLDPSGKHIALGGDLDGCETLPKGFSGIQDYDKLAEQLLNRGMSEDMVYNVFWNNALSVFQRCCG